MSKPRKIALTIAGFDPSGGAGILADVKTLEQHKVYSYAVQTANTIQSSDTFDQVNWIDKSTVLDQLNLIATEAKFDGVKIGLIHDFSFLLDVIDQVKKNNPNAYIIWDPILSASAGFEFHKEVDETLLNEVLSKIDLITPNKPEAKQLFGIESPEQIAEKKLACNVYLKGGHDKEQLGKDYLIENDKIFPLNPKNGNYSPKHGSGCVLSSSLLGNKLKGYPSIKMCLKSKRYVEDALGSNNSLLAYHRK